MSQQQEVFTWTIALVAILEPTSTLPETTRRPIAFRVTKVPTPRPEGPRVVLTVHQVRTLKQLEVIRSLIASPVLRARLASA